MPSLYSVLSSRSLSTMFVYISDSHFVLNSTVNLAAALSGFHSFRLHYDLHMVGVSRPWCMYLSAAPTFSTMLWHNIEKFFLIHTAMMVTRWTYTTMWLSQRNV